MKSGEERISRLRGPVCFLALIVLLQPVYGQTRDTQSQIPVQTQAATSPVNSEALHIGIGDELEITVFGAPDLSAHGRVGADGNVSMPVLGYVHVVGMTSAEAEVAIAQQLERKGVVNQPQVSVFVKEYTGSEISVAGEVKKPGVYSILGPHRLLDILQSAGGLTEKAGNAVTISHRSGEITTIDLSKDPAVMARSNIDLQPGDTVIVPQAGIVYVLGEVYRPGGFVSSSAGGFTVLQIIAAAGGPTHLASAGKTIMLRRTANGFQQIPVPLHKLMKGQKPDMPVVPDDILYVPSSALKSVLSLGSIVTLSSQAAVYRIP